MARKRDVGLADQGSASESITARRVWWNVATWILVAGTLTGMLILAVHLHPLVEDWLGRQETDGLFVVVSFVVVGAYILITPLLVFAVIGAWLVVVMLLMSAADVAILGAVHDQPGARLSRYMRRVKRNAERRRSVADAGPGMARHRRDVS